MDADLALALELQKEFNEEFQRDIRHDGFNTPKKKKSFLDITSPNSKISVIDPSLEYSDPTPDIFKMFTNFDRRFFWSSLGSVEVMWSPRMTSCAGICRYRSGNGATTIHLSLPLLKLRPRKDLVETLLHEMIHAYLFVTKNNKDRDGHGPEFQSHMHRINKSAGTHITIYHDFHAEVNVYKTHWWRCNGPCQYQKPFYGMVKRSMNRAPGPNDFWYAEHQRNCGGTFVKVREPENFKSKKTNTKLTEKGKQGNSSPSKMKSMQDYFKKVNTKPKVEELGARTVTKNGAYTNTKFGSSMNTKHGTSANENVKAGVPSKGIVTMSNLKDKEQDECHGSHKTSPIKQDVVPFSGKGYTMGKTTASVADKPWLKRFDSTSPSISSAKGLGKSVSNQSRIKQFDSSVPSTSSGKTSQTSRKVPSTVPLSTGESKKMKLGDSDGKNNCEDDSALCTVACPICNVSVSASEVNEHLDSCLNGSFVEDDISDSRCVVCDQILGRKCDVPSLCTICEQGACSSDFDIFECQSDDSFIVCPMCDKKMTCGDLERHLELCIIDENGQVNALDEQDDDDVITLD